MKTPKPPQILSAKELEALYQAALETDSALISSIALQAHAGLRAGELSELDLNNIDFEERQIRIISPRKAGIRIIHDVPDAVWHWLEYCKSQDLLTIPNNLLLRFRRLFKRAGVEPVRGILRNSFASHLLALTGESNLVGRILGRSIQIVSGHILPVDSKREAKAYFSVKPRK